jgi:hypothetical protein
MSRIRKGDLVQLSFRDHAEGTDHFEFTTYGRVQSQTRLAIVVCCWQYADTKKPVCAEDANVIVHTILKSTITRIQKLVPV